MKKIVLMIKYMLNFEYNQLREKARAEMNITHLLRIAVTDADKPEELKKWLTIYVNDLYSLKLSWKDMKDKYDTQNMDLNN